MELSQAIGETFVRMLLHTIMQSEQPALEALKLIEHSKKGIEHEEKSGNSIRLAGGTNE